MWDFRLRGSGKGDDGVRSERDCLCVIDSGQPRINQGQSILPMRQFLTTTGDSSGSEDMRVNGSSTDQEFYITTPTDRDRYIVTLSFVIADASQTLNEFGNLGSALGTGCKLSYSYAGGEVVINDGLTTNWEFVRLCSGNPAFGTTTDAFRASNVSGSAEGYIPVLDFKKTFGFQWGLRLRGGTRQRVSLFVRDDLSSGIDQFDCVAYGFDVLETEVV